MQSYPTKRFSIPTGPSGVAVVTGTVTAIDDDGYAQVQTDFGTVIRASVRVVPGKASQPKEDERWLLDARLGVGWTFSHYLGHTDDRQVGWQAPAFQPGWSHFSAPSTPWAAGTAHYASVAYRLDVSGLVVLRGTAAGPAVSGADAVGPLSADIFQLPTWACPDADGLLSFVTATGTIKVYPDGWVRAVTGAATKVALDGVSFLAA